MNYRQHSGSLIARACGLQVEEMDNRTVNDWIRIMCEDRWNTILVSCSSQTSLCFTIVPLGSEIGRCQPCKAMHHSGRWNRRKQRRLRLLNAYFPDKAFAAIPKFLRTLQARAERKKLQLELSVTKDYQKAIFMWI